MLKKAILGPVLALGAMVGMAQAATLTGTFEMDIYTYDAGGSSAAAAATAANVAAQGATTAQVTYTGAIDFATVGGATTVMNFLDSGTGGYVVNSGSVAGLMTAGGFTTTTLFDITATIASAFDAIVSHDDGISVYENGGLIADSSNPTSEIDTAFTFGGGDLRLIYSAANGNPEVLNVEISPIPVPAAGFLLVGALGGLVAVRRRRKAAA